MLFLMKTEKNNSKIHIKLHTQINPLKQTNKQTPEKTKATTTATTTNPNRQSMLGENSAGGFTIPDSKLYYGAML